MTPEPTTSEQAGGDARSATLAVLAQHVRDLVDAVVLTDVPEEELTAVSSDLVALTERLRPAGRTASLPHEIGPDGRFRPLGNAVSGQCNPHALPLVVERTPQGGSRAELLFRPTHEGPSGFVHGGVIAMVLDHLLGEAAAASGGMGMTGTLSVRYARPVPYGAPLMGHAAVSRAEGRKTWAGATISSAEGTTLVEATAVFITPAQWVAVPPPSAPVAG